MKQWLLFLCLAACVQAGAQNAYQQRESCTQAIYDWYDKAQKAALDKYTVALPPSDGTKPLKACNNPWMDRVCRAHRHYCSCPPCEQLVSQAYASVEKEKESRLAQCEATYKAAAAREEQQQQQKAAAETRAQAEKDRQQAAKAASSSPGKTTAATSTSSGYTSSYTPSAGLLALQQTQNYINQSNLQREQMTQTLTEGIQNMGNLLMQMQERKQKEREAREARMETYRQQAREEAARKQQQLEERAGQGYMEDMAALADLKMKSGYDLAAAHLLYVQTAVLGNTNAMYGLSVDYRQGRGTEKNDSLAQFWLQKAASYGNTTAMRAINTGKWKRFGEFLDRTLSINTGKAAVLRAYAQAYESKGTSEGITTALSYWQQYYEWGKENNKWAKKQGKDKVKELTKRIKEHRYTTREQPDSSGHDWFNKGMDHYALFNQPDTAISYFKMAAEEGDTEAAFMLARLYYEKQPHTPENTEQLISTYLKADNNRKAYACRAAANVLVERAKEYAQQQKDSFAISYLQRAALMNDLTALGLLAGIYETGTLSYYADGKKVENTMIAAKDEKEAQKWKILWKNAAEKENKIPEYRIDYAINHIVTDYPSTALADKIKDLEYSYKITNALIGKPGEFCVTFGSNGYSAGTIAPGLRKALSEINNARGNIDQVVRTFKPGSYAVICNNNGYYTNDIPAALLKELSRCHQQGLKIANVSITPSGGWVVINGSSGYSYAGIPSKLATKIEELNKARSTINYIAFTKKGGWVIVYDDYGYQFDNIPVAATQQIREFNGRHTKISFIGFDDAEHFIIN